MISEIISQLSWEMVPTVRIAQYTNMETYSYNELSFWVFSSNKDHVIHGKIQ